MDGTPPVSGSDGPATILTFLIADVRGYTRFTQTHGDEAAAHLASVFADIATEVVTASGGRVQELRGDEAMCVFGSPRQAVRAAVELQRRFVAATIADPRLPLAVGIGIDAGEAVPVKDGYRGGALNLAARLCSLATGGEILASREIVHLARHVEGVSYAERSKVALKGIDKPQTVVKVIPDDDPAADPAFLSAAQAQPSGSPRNRRRAMLAAAVVGVAAVVAAILIVVSGNGKAAGLRTIGTDSVGIVNLDGHSLTDRVSVGAGPASLASSGSTVWVANTTDGTVSSIDVNHTAVANTVPVGNDPAGLAVADGALWVSDASNRVVDRVDTRSKTVVDTIGVGNGPTAVAVSGGTVWVVNSLDATVSAIDAKNDKVIGTTPVGGLPNALATGDDGVWVANSSSASVSRIDPVSHRVTATIPVGNEPSALAVIGGDVWVANALDGTLSRIDAATNSVTETIQVGGQPNALAADGGTMWVGDAVGDHVSEIDAASGRVSHVVPLGDTPNALVVAAGRLWVSAGGSAALHRGGTLNVAIDPTESINSLDPAVGYRTVSWSIESVIYDGLVTFRRVGGPGGTQVVPDLAQELPSVTDAGRSYTFQLRRGVRFSDGSVVKPSDVARSFARMLPLSQASPYYSAIIGASQCASGHCAGLSRGIVADDAANTVTLHLTHPDPELLYKLALPFASVLGGSPPHHDARLRPLVGTGPYVIDPNPAKDHLTLERNPRFRQWSPAAQPSGYPNSIDATFVRGRSARAQAVTATGRGTYDIAPDLLTSQELSGLRRDRPTQLHPFRESFTSFFFLNTRIAPFNDVRVRRAVNYAFDRKREVAAFGGQFFATVTCQVLPPTLFGFRPYCPYTTGADASGVWRHPDLARARSLVRAAGVRGDTVRVAVNSTQTQPYAELEKTLRTLGFHVTTHVVPNHIGGYYLYVDHLANHVQTGLDGWFADFPAPSNFIETLLSCTSIAHASSGLTPNDADFCNRSIDAEISRALALQTTDPASAAASWSHIDRQITDLAPWVPLVNDQGWDLVSSRVGNYQHNPEWGVLLDQLWVH